MCKKIEEQKTKPPLVLSEFFYASFFELPNENVANKSFA